MSDPQMTSRERPLSPPQTRDTSPQNLLNGSEFWVNGTKAEASGIQAPQIATAHKRWLGTGKGRVDIVVDGDSLELIDLVAVAR